MDFSKLIRDVSEAARSEGVGLAILIDEAQDLSSEELTAVCASAHLAGQREWACLFALAGLPSLPRELAEAKSYAERLFLFERIEQLDEGIAALALVAPAADEGVTWDRGAVDLVVRDTAGYPYFLQQFGQEAWNEASGHVITLADARVASARSVPGSSAKVWCTPRGTGWSLSPCRAWRPSSSDNQSMSDPEGRGAPGDPQPAQPMNSAVFTP